ncbi:protein mono-ADP-ribosyltransferase PARP10 isoform X3 [Panthera leo]|uniref:protein mono-ADP-ribosyltransferase PARP10 isoform X3 n=1 Tax=Panthera leo TaxID=9689 RepID=UPI001C69E99F|nr:protein mono-ADP-ribosyltransferase PARP10 isoform X3 [Panthera leo]
MLGVGDGGTPVRSWRRPGRGGVGTFQEPAVAQVVLHQDHRLQESELSLLPHEPENLAKDTSGGDCPVELEPGATEHAVLEAGGPARALKGAGTVTLGSEEAPAQPHPGWAWPLTQRRSEGRWPPWRTPMGRAGRLQSRGQRSLRGSLHPGPGGAWAAASGDVLAASGPWSFKAGRPSRRTLCAAASPCRVPGLKHGVVTPSRGYREDCSFHRQRARCRSGIFCLPQRLPQQKQGSLQCFHLPRCGNSERGCASKTGSPRWGTSAPS